ncbi:FAD/NAD(P)-binding domain-containing protein [Penicillium argentinense]|uniref:FAD/NAD(P)-binding domain-containing protein n=1 Tax=Penicillium argentinense TaxID=1131581 RepID=A0A9W9EI95_9EURO|nr:FAD/NAD(P)-binding domain-containing protein [Penicillium argentinense]KAJ5082294.1 FAD/NAD(P)-binding domain-containing protein [Penicillium argentinense]
MPPLKVLICGGGCAGPALAYWLARTGHHVTIVERFPALRATGAQIDLRGQGIEVVRRMGLDDTIRRSLVDEAGVSFVDFNGNVKATVMANKTGKGTQSLTSEYEIMRGDLVRILFQATKDNAKYIFGKTVDHFTQDDNSVTAYFSDGSSDTYDLLVGADGQGSRIRKAILPPDAPDPYRRLGIHMAYWSIPREEGDDNIRRSYITPGGRMIMRRTHSLTQTQVYFFLKDDSPELSSVPRAPAEKQKEFWTQRFHDAQWQASRFLEGMKSTENWYCQEVVQVHTDTWYKGRVVLLGDASSCPSPFSGMGTTGSLVGAYVLAGEINRHRGDISKAFVNYDKIFRPFVDEVQDINIFLLRLAIPESWWGIAIMQFILRLLCFLRIPQIVSRFSKERDGDWKLPEYPELRETGHSDE